MDYSIPFGLVASVVPHAGEPAEVALRTGERLQLERSGVFDALPLR